MAFDRAYLYLTATDDNGRIAGKYKRLSFFYSEIPGGTDEAGHAIGPVRTVSIMANGYWGSFPSKLDLEGILSTLGFDMTSIDVFHPTDTMHNESKTQYGHRSKDVYIYNQAIFPVPAPASSAKPSPSSAAAAS